MRWLTLRNCLKVFVVILWEEGDVSHLEGARLSFRGILVALYLLVLSVCGREQSISTCRTHQR